MKNPEKIDQVKAIMLVVAISYLGGKIGGSWTSALMGAMFMMLVVGFLERTEGGKGMSAVIGIYVILIILTLLWG